MTTVTHTASQPSLPHDVRVFQGAVNREFAFLKATRRYDELFVKGLPMADGQGTLVPLADVHMDDAALVQTLSRWREENYFAYPTQFKVTVEGTGKWLKAKVLEVSDRVLFLVHDRHGRLVGHLGFANCVNPEGEAEIDNVVRGVKDAQPGIMSLAMKTVLDWAEEVLGPRRIFLRVMEDNQHAVTFYGRLGFVDDARIPLRKHVEGETVAYKPLEAGDRRAPDKVFLRMLYRPNARAVGREMILTAGPSISSREAYYAWDAARTGWNSNWAGYLKRFESGFAQYLGAKHAIATSSCTGALHIAMMALGIGPGDEVVVPDITWVATANAVAYVGATPVFADVDPKSWTLDPSALEKAITKRTKAIVPVHLYGHPARMDRLMQIARDHNLRVIEDAAPSLGAEVNGRKTGTFGDFSAFSFQGAKVTVTGEGGMLVTSDPELYKKAYKIWDQGRDATKTFWIDEPGVKYKMANVQAALGLGQLERIDTLVEAKRRIFGWYQAGLKGVPHVTLNQEESWARSIYWMSSILVDVNAPLTRDQLMAFLKEKKVDSRPVFPAISQYPLWKTPRPANTVADRVGKQAINLPSGVKLRKEQVDYVCTCIRGALGTR